MEGQGWTRPCKGTHEVSGGRGGQDATSTGSNHQDMAHQPGQGLALSASSTERGDPRIAKSSLLVFMDEEVNMAEKGLELVQQGNAEH